MPIYQCEHVGGSCLHSSRSTVGVKHRARCNQLSAFSRSMMTLAAFISESS